METEIESGGRLKKLLIEELKNIYWCEKMLVKSVQKIYRKATDEGLAKALNTHFSETTHGVKRLEHIFQILSVKPLAKRCQVMASILEETKTIISGISKGATRDACIILSVRIIKQHEIATYSTLLTFTDKLKLTEASKLLKETLYEEKKTDQALNDMAEANINEWDLLEFGLEGVDHGNWYNSSITRMPRI